MRIYAAASTSKGDSGYDRVLEVVEYPHVLIAYPYDEDCGYIGQPFDRGLRRVPDTVITDSGAFTVWKTGGRVDVGAYEAYCHRYRAKSDTPPTIHVNLDVMPGEFGRLPTKREKEAGMRQSVANADRLRASGLPIMEVYHQFEPVEFLDELLDRRQPGDVLGISPRNDAAMSTRRLFCDGVFAHLLARYGKELPPCHGLGVGSRTLIWRYPWYSVDALSWVAPGIFGRVMGRNGVTKKGAEQGSRNRDLRHHACAEYLRRWMKWMPELDALWARRGITWQP